MKKPESRRPGVESLESMVLLSTVSFEAPPIARAAAIAESPIAVTHPGSIRAVAVAVAGPSAQAVSGGSTGRVAAIGSGSASVIRVVGSGRIEMFGATRPAFLGSGSGNAAGSRASALATTGRVEAISSGSARIVAVGAARFDVHGTGSGNALPAAHPSSLATLGRPSAIRSA